MSKTIQSKRRKAGPAQVPYQEGPPEEAFPIRVKQVGKDDCSTVLMFEVKTKDYSVLDLKNRIFQEQKIRQQMDGSTSTCPIIPVSRQRLIWSGRLLNNNSVLGSKALPFRSDSPNFIHLAPLPEGKQPSARSHLEAASIIGGSSTTPTSPPPNPTLPTALSELREALQRSSESLSNPGHATSAALSSNSTLRRTNRTTRRQHHSQHRRHRRNQPYPPQMTPRRLHRHESPLPVVTRHDAPAASRPEPDTDLPPLFASESLAQQTRSPIIPSLLELYSPTPTPTNIVLNPASLQQEDTIAILQRVLRERTRQTAAQLLPVVATLQHQLELIAADHWEDEDYPTEGNQNPNSQTSNSANTAQGMGERNSPASTLLPAQDLRPLVFRPHLSGPSSLLQSLEITSQPSLSSSLLPTAMERLLTAAALQDQVSSIPFSTLMASASGCLYLQSTLAAGLVPPTIVPPILLPLVWTQQEQMTLHQVLRETLSQVAPRPSSFRDP